MEPVTHVLTGVCLARAGLNRRAAYATAAMAIAAELPDIDTLWALKGPVSAFEHHRGITHTFVGIPFEAAGLVFCFWLFHRWKTRSQALERQEAERRSPRGLGTAIAPVRWTVLYAFTLVALLSHLLLDYTNNYGLRPFFPFNPRWYAASIVFIFDPVILLLLLAGLLLPSIFGLVGREMGAGQEPFRGRGWARAALLGIVLLWGVRYVEHHKAVELADGQTLRAPGSTSLALDEANRASPGEDGSPAPADQRQLLLPRVSLASPDPLSIFRWYTATDFGPAYRLGVADTRIGALSPGEVLTKPQPNPASSTARTTHLGRVYLDWSMMPLISASSGLAAAGSSDLSLDRGDTVVSFQDLRFAGDTPLLHRNARSPLTGIVVLNAAGKVLLQGTDGRFGQ